MRRARFLSFVHLWHSSFSSQIFYIVIFQISWTVCQVRVQLWRRVALFRRISDATVYNGKNSLQSLQLIIRSTNGSEGLSAVRAMQLNIAVESDQMVIWQIVKELLSVRSSSVSSGSHRQCKIHATGSSYRMVHLAAASHHWGRLVAAKLAVPIPWRDADIIANILTRSLKNLQRR